MTRLLPGSLAVIGRITVLLVALTSAAVADEGRPAPRSAPAVPDVDFRSLATPYAGPGRERAEPTDVSEVLLGYFGPGDPDHSDWGDAWRAATIAIDEVNRDGGWHGKPFRLVPAWSDNPWTAGASHVARLAYRDKVWAIIGGFDGPTAHLAEQVVAKARLPLISPTNPDRTANVANVPWMFSLLPGDHLQAPVLARVLARRAGAKGYAVLSSTDHDPRRFVLELERATKPLGLAPRFAYSLPDADPGKIAATVQQVIGEDLGAVVVAANPQTSAHVVQELRKARYAGLILGNSDIGRRLFWDSTGRDAEGVLFPLLFDPDAAPPLFRKLSNERPSVPPDFTSAYTYDAVMITVSAVRRAGLNRAKIGDALREIVPWQGVTGIIEWDRLGSNDRPVALGTIRAGKTVRAEKKD